MSENEQPKDIIVISDEENTVPDKIWEALDSILRLNAPTKPRDEMQDAERPASADESEPQYNAQPSFFDMLLHLKVKYTGAVPNGRLVVVKRPAPEKIGSIHIANQAMQNMTEKTTEGYLVGWGSDVSGRLSVDCTFASRVVWPMYANDDVKVDGADVCIIKAESVLLVLPTNLKD